MTEVHLVQRYIRTDQDRLGQWQPAVKGWKTAASSGLVAHDIYHHLPSDTGTFADEVRALGAEWYVDVQPLADSVDHLSARKLKNLERAAQDIVLNALDSKEEFPFNLTDTDEAPASSAEAAFFKKLAQTALQALENSSDGRAKHVEQFTERFVSLVAQGVRLAKDRFPSQELVRRGAYQLSRDLSDLELSDVPYGYAVTLTLVGYDTLVTFEDADESFRKERRPLNALMMTWCSNEAGYPASFVTLHSDETSFQLYVRDHFAAQDAQEGLAPEEDFIPEGESQHLTKVYVTSPEVKKALLDGRTPKVEVSQILNTEQSPRGVFVF